MEALRGSEYLEKLWIAYQSGPDKTGATKKEIFFALIADLIKQIECARPTPDPNTKIYDGLDMFIDDDGNWSFKFQLEIERAMEGTTTESMLSAILEVCNPNQEEG